MFFMFHDMYASSILSCILFEVGTSGTQNITYIHGELNLKIQWQSWIDIEIKCQTNVATLIVEYVDIFAGLQQYLQSLCMPVVCLVINQNMLKSADLFNKKPII